MLGSDRIVESWLKSRTLETPVNILACEPLKISPYRYEGSDIILSSKGFRGIRS